MKKFIYVLTFAFLLGNTSKCLSEPGQAAPLPTSYAPYGPFDCLKGWGETNLCPYNFLEAVICELEQSICLINLITDEAHLQRSLFVTNYWDYIITNSDHEFNSALNGANLIYFNNLSFSEQSDIYALTICHMNAASCYDDSYVRLTIYQPDEIICDIINGKKWCLKPSDGAICQISPLACGGIDIPD